MADLAPLNFQPSGPFSPLLNYWHCTIARLIYFDRDDLLDKTLGVAGATLADRERFEQTPTQGGLFLPRTDVYHLFGGDLVHIRGTVGNVELLTQIAASGLAAFPFWTGKVVAYLGLISPLVYTRIAGSLGPTWAAAGHSLGGAIAGLISVFGASKVWTLGQQREGNLEYAGSRINGHKLRLHNLEDVVPKTPSALGSVFGGWLDLLSPVPAPSLLSDCWHWGESWRLSPLAIVNDPRQDHGAVVDLAAFLRGGGSLAAGIYYHSPEVYAFRIRSLLPYRFPADKTAPTLPGLGILDEVNQAINLGPLADQLGGPVVWDIRETTSQRSSPPGDAAGAYQDWNEYADELENDVYPFRCPDE